MEQISITGRFVSRLNAKYNSDFCINKVYLKSSENLPLEVENRSKKGKGYEITVVGYNLPTSKAKYYGYFEKSKYGMQFKASTYEFVTPDTKQGIITFLSSKTFKGIGKSMATAIVDEFGMQSLDVIKHTPEQLLKIRGLSIKKINALSNKLKSTEYYNQLAIFLNTYGNVESNKIMKIAQELGSKAENAIKENPYCITDIDGIGFLTADSIAKAIANNLDKENLCKMLGSYKRICAATKYELKANSARSGGTYTEYQDIFNMVYHTLNDGFPITIVSYEELGKTFSQMTNEGIIQIFNINNIFAVFDAESNRNEKDIAYCLMEMQSNVIPENIKEGYEMAFENIKMFSEVDFSADQENAIKNILNNKVSVLTGGPGTGKSTCLKAIIDCYKAVHGENANITQVAPTGRAARRMTESTGLPADTIHRMCGIYHNTDKYNVADKMIPDGLIICDESSMVDSSVMRILCANISLENSTFIIVGDEDQLPSVGAGAVLRDIIASKSIPTMKLTTNHRQATGAGLIVDNASKINRGNIMLNYDEERFRFISSTNEDDALKKILHVYDEECKKWGIDNVTILCPRRQKVNVCVDNINTELQNIVNPKVNGDASITIGKQEFRVRDRVIQMKNTEFASNGDVGIIKAITYDTNDSGDGEMVIRITFEGNTTLDYSIEDMQNVSLAYALTIHKSQGSEYKSVIMPFLSSQKCALFQRNLIYTGVTRAKEKVTIIGDKDAISYCIRTDNGFKRNTLLEERLRKYTPKKS